jgi:hypothetical protein
VRLSGSGRRSGNDDPFDPHLPRSEYDWLIREVEGKLAEGVDAEQLAA